MSDIHGVDRVAQKKEKCGNVSKAIPKFVESAQLRYVL